MKATISAETASKLLGLHEKLTNAEYHRGPGYSASDIIRMGDGFDQWAWHKAHPSEPTAAMTLGSVTHLLLEAEIKHDPSLVTNGVAIMPEFNGRTNEGKAAKADFMAAHAGKYLITQDDMDHARRMVEAVLSTPAAAGYLCGGVAEPSIYAYYPGTQVLSKCRPDYLRIEDGLSINFKTTDDASYSGFIRSVANFAYDWQSAYYLDVLGAHFKRSFDEIHILVERNKDGGPCRVGIYSIRDEKLDFARAQYQQLIAMIPECERTGHWPALSAELEIVDLPSYAQKVVRL